MRAMVLHSPRHSLQLEELTLPQLGSEQLLIKVRACGVCRTDLHILDGELPHPKLPLILGHEIVGTAVKIGSKVKDFAVGDRIGVPWLGSTCGKCAFCLSHRENLCDHAGFTGYTLDGGYAEFCVANARFCFLLPSNYSDAEVAPLLCAGLIGYRSLKMVGEAKKIGVYGFGAAAHIITQVTRYQGREIYAFTRPGDREGQEFARRLGAAWAGDSDMVPPEQLEAAIIFAPLGSLVPRALKTLAKGGRVVCAGIHMSEIPAFPYELLWGEREICSVANLTRSDGEEFLALAPKVPVKTEVQRFQLSEANDALARLREGKIQGAAVLCMD